MLSACDIITPKGHTIRAGDRWSVGDKFSPRFWSGKPYNSKQVIIAPDIEIKNVYPFAIFPKKNIDKMPYGSTCIFVNNRQVSADFIQELAKNDGLETADLLLWFNCPTEFYGQVIVWSENITYK